MGVFGVGREGWGVALAWRDGFVGLPLMLECACIPSTSSSDFISRHRRHRIIFLLLSTSIKTQGHD